MSGIRVTATDTESGESSTAEVMDNYVLITAGTCYLAHQAVHANGTVVLTIKGRKS